MKTFYWLIKREFWENRGGFFWAPVITAGVFLTLYVMGIFALEVIGIRHGMHFGVGGDFNQVISQMDRGDMNDVGIFLDVTMYSSAGSGHAARR